MWLVTEWRGDGRKGNRPIARRAEELDATDVDIIAFARPREYVVQDRARLRERLRLEGEQDCCLHLHLLFLTDLPSSRTRR